MQAVNQRKGVSSMKDDNTKGKEEQSVSLINLNGGAAVELFDDELQKAFDNIGDPNTKPDAVREVTLTVKLHPDEKRRYCDITIQAKSKTAPVRESSTMVFLGKKAGSSRVIASERNLDQMTIEEAIQKESEPGPRPVTQIERSKP
jgi:hypothetical protein